MKSYIKFLSRNKLYTAIEAVGLAVSLAFVILLGTYIWQQYKVIYENPDADRIFILGTADGRPGLSRNEKIVFQSDPLPEIEVMARYSLENEYPVSIDGELRLVKAGFADRELFEIFPYYEFMAGSSALFDDMANVLVSESFANTLGRGHDVIGMAVVDVKNERQYTVAGIIENFNNTFFRKADIIINARSIWPDNSPLEYSSFGGVYNFIRLGDNEDADIVEDKVTGILKSAAPHVFMEEDFKPTLYTMEEVFFMPYNTDFNSADATMLKILLIIAVALLISAVFNYVNLSFALVTKRAKEMATRRLVGAGKEDILWKCICESVVFTVVCFGVALMLAVAFEPLLNSLLVGRSPDSFVAIDIPFDFAYAAVCLISAVLLGCVVGIVPAVSSSAFAPVDVIKGGFRRRSKMIFSKCFIVIQNTLAVILIAMGILMEVQLSHIVNLPMNADTDNLFYIETEFLENPEMAQPLYDALMKNPDVKRVGYGKGFPGYIRSSKSYVSVGNPAGEYVRPLVLTCDSTYFDMLDPHITENLHTPLVGSLWLSESASTAMQLTDSTAAAIFNSRWNPLTDHIGGTYKDILPMLETVRPTVLEVVSWDKFYGVSMIVETVTESKDIRDSIIKTYEEFSKDCIGVVLMSGMSGFMNDLHKKMLAPTVRFVRLVEIFMILAVLLSLMGLVAMSTYFSEQKSKEIAVRKVFGGTVGTETIANVRSYMILVLTACVIGVPIAVYLSGLYLEQFVYRIETVWWIFVVAVLFSFAISLLSVLWQTLKAALTNPADELNKE